MMRYREIGTTPTCNTQLRYVLLGLLYYSLCMLLIACSTSNGQEQSGSTATTTAIKPITVVPTLTTSLLAYKGHTGPVIGAAWSPDGKNISSCGNDGTVQVWQAGTGQMLWKALVSRYTFAVAWSPDGRKVAAAGADSTIAIFDAATGHSLATFSNNAGFIEGLAWSPDSASIAVSSQEDDTVKIWDVQTSKLLITYTGHNAGVERVAWSPDGTRIASASYDGTVHVWDAKTGQHLLTYKGHNASVWEVAWSPDSKYIVSGTGAAGVNHPVTTNNSVKVWNATTGKTILTYTGSTSQAYALAWSPDGKTIASGGDDKIVHVWDAKTGKTLLQYQGHTDVIFKVAWSPDGSTIASASADGTVQVWQPHK